MSGKPPRGWQRILECFRDPSSSRRSEVNRQLTSILSKEKSDLVWFHNIAGGGKWGWSEEMVRIARDHVPVMWTLHDMWALGSGEESYWEVEETEARRGKREGASGGKREGESAEVGRCEGSKVARVWGAGGKYPVTLTAPSKWLADSTCKLTGLPCVHLPNPIDLDLFSPGDQAEARRRLGLPEKGLVVLAGADSLQDPRKGFDLLLAAWEQFRAEGVTLALFGRHGQTKPGQVYLGNLVTDEQMVAAYRAADLYVHPAQMENAPCTIQESLACGTPVLAFAVGGIPEMVRDGKNGFLAKEISAPSLQATIALALADRGRLVRLRKDAREWAKEVWRSDALEHRFRSLAGGL